MLGSGIEVIFKMMAHSVIKWKIKSVLSIEDVDNKKTEFKEIL